MRFRAAVAAVLIFYCMNAFATQCGNWRWLHPTPKVAGPSALGWNGSRVVGVGASNGTFFSDNGRDWTAGDAVNRWDLRSVTGSPSRWIAVGHRPATSAQARDTGTIESSSDGRTWNAVAVGDIPALNSVTWTGSQFVAVGAQGALLTSLDGLAWTRRASVTNLELNAVAASGAKIVAVGVTGVMVTSETGEFWETAEVGGNNKPMLNGVAWTGSRFVAVGAGTMKTSENGNTWVPVTIPNLTIPWLYGVVSSGQQTLAWSSGKILSSTDGYLWSVITPGPTSFPSDIVWAGTQFVAARNGGLEGMSSLDGRDWAPMTFGSRLTKADLSGVQLGTDRLVAVGRELVSNSVIAPVALTSTNGETWSIAQTVGNGEWLAVSGNSQLLVAVGANGTVATSTNGTTWTARSSGVTQRLLDVTWSGAQFVAAGEAGTIITSSDGVTWQTRMNNTVFAMFHRVIHTDLRWIVLGQKSIGGNNSESVIYTSTDGAQWQPVTFPSGMHIEILASGGPRLLAVGGTMAMSSSDGLAWTNLAAPLPEALVDLIWVDDHYAGLTKSGETYVTTTDGAAWTTEPLPIAGLKPAAMRRLGDRLVAVGNGGAIAAATCSATPTKSPASVRQPGTRTAGSGAGDGTALVALAALWRWRSVRRLRRSP